jgi:hypothetical protein
MTSLKTRAADMRVTGSVTYVDTVTRGGYVQHNWKIVMRCNETRKQYTFPMFTGDLAGEPTIVEALNCLIVDSQCYFNASSFLEFCEEFGYDPDSISHRETYDGCGKAYQNMKRVFGMKNFKTLLFDTESL